MNRTFLAMLFLFLSAESARGQNFAPPPAQPPDAATLKTIGEKADRLQRALGTLRRQGVRDDLLVEVEVYLKAARWIVKHNEFYPADAGQWTLECLDRGLLRAALLAQGDAPWLQQVGFDVVRAYRSRVDGSVQPYAVTFPEGYGRDARQRWRIDVVLHGRDSSLTEVKFLHQHNGERSAGKDQDFIRIDIFGRLNNAYRWAGETDVFEALEAFVAVERALGRDGLLDPARVVLRGFSMGGAGTWHLGLHRPDRWCVLGPGAGFSITHGYVANLPKQLPPYQEACLHIYDAVDYADNIFNLPVVAYGGDQDPQLQAARNIEARIKGKDYPFQLLVAPGLGHQFPPEWQKKAMAEYARFADKGRNPNPERVRFVTWTMKYPFCDWVEILGLDEHYQPSLVDARQTANGLEVETRNVRALRLAMQFAGPEVTVKIDGQELTTRPLPSQGGPLNVFLQRRAGQWQAVLPQKILTDRLRRPQKVTNLQGPIDDAFMDSFLCVRGTGQPWHSATHQYLEAALQRFQDDWEKFFRGELPVKDDRDVTEEDIAGRHLVLFGDPASNSLVGQVLDRLPLTWTREEIVLAGQKFPSASHVPALIYPSPLNTNRYVVLNSGHTFHTADLRGTNALLFPRLGDYAVLRLTPPTPANPRGAETALAGLFDDFWQISKK